MLYICKQTIANAGIYFKSCDIENNIIHSFIGLNGLKWYAKCSDCSSKKHNDNHPHFQCEECNEVRCIPNVTNEPELIGSQFHVKKILISGLCSRCFSV